MLVVPPTIPSVYQTNLLPGSTSLRSGTTITASATPHSAGPWTSIIDPTDKPSYGVGISIQDVAASATDTSMLVDIAYGPIGGGNEKIIWPNVNAGGAPGQRRSREKYYFLPGIYVPSGVRVSARCRALIVSDTATIAIWLGQDAPYSFLAGEVQDYGADESASRGTSVTPGNDAWGTWTEIATTVRAHRVWTIGMDAFADTSIGFSTLPWLVQIGVGPDSGNVSMIAGTFRVSASSDEIITGPLPSHLYGVVPRGQKLWARIASGTPEARGVIIYGVD